MTKPPRFPLHGLIDAALESGPYAGALPVLLFCAHWARTKAKTGSLRLMAWRHCPAMHSRPLPRFALSLILAFVGMTGRHR